MDHPPDLGNHLKDHEMATTPNRNQSPTADHARLPTPGLARDQAAARWQPLDKLPNFIATADDLAFLNAQGMATGIVAGVMSIRTTDVARAADLLRARRR